MSQPDLARTLREARPVAPPELRERVRLVAAEASTPRRQLVTWRRALLVAVVAGAAIAAGVIATRPSHNAASLEGIVRRAFPDTPGAPINEATATDHSSLTGAPAAPSPSAKRLQQYTASLELRVPTGAAVSRSTQHAIAIANSLGGYLAFVNVNTSGKTGYAEIRLRIPKLHVVEAMRRLSALGTITSENIRIQDLQAGVNTTDRSIARLQAKLAALRLQTQTTLVQRQVAALTAQIERLQRGRSNTARSARYATVSVGLSTAPPPAVKPHHHGPFHGVGTVFRWIGIGAVYGLAFGAPLLALAALTWLVARAIRRRREDSLLSRP